jgi:DNA-directed RNA polymerase IV subunit 1
MVMNIFQAFTLLKKLDPEFIKKFISKREWVFLSSIPVTANNHRVSETYPAYADGPLLVFVSLLHLLVY